MDCSMPLSCPSPSPWACSNSCPLSWWCHPTILSSLPLLLPSICPSIRVFPNHWLLASGGQSVGALASVLPMNMQGWFPWGLTYLISLQSKGLSGVFSSNLKASVLWHSTFFMIQLSHLCMTGKTIALTIWTFVGRVMSLLFNMLSRFVIAFLPRSKPSFSFMVSVTVCNDFWSPRKYSQREKMGR